MLGDAPSELVGELDAAESVALNVGEGEAVLVGVAEAVLVSVACGVDESPPWVAVTLSVAVPDVVGAAAEMDGVPLALAPRLDVEEGVSVGIGETQAVAELVLLGDGELVGERVSLLDGETVVVSVSVTVAVVDDVAVAVAVRETVVEALGVRLLLAPRVGVVEGVGESDGVTDDVCVAVGVSLPVPESVDDNVACVDIDGTALALVLAATVAEGTDDAVAVSEFADVRDD